MSAILNISIDAGSTFSNEITVNDSNDIAIDLTGYVLKGQIRKSYRSLNPVAEFVMDIIDAPNGKIRLNLTSEQTENIKSGRYQYDIEITSPGIIDQIIGIKVTAGGTGYTSAPTATLSAGGATTAATLGTVVLTNNEVSSVPVLTPGSGYISDPLVTFSGGGGAGALAISVRGQIVSRVVEGIFTVTPEITK